jgi:hypothetical protein
MKVGVAERAAALDAIRRAGVELTGVLDVWVAASFHRRQVFVTALSATLERGDLYDTWLVTIAGDGSVISVERFHSTACSRRNGHHRA